MKIQLVSAWKAITNSFLFYVLAGFVLFTCVLIVVFRALGFQRPIRQDFARLEAQQSQAMEIGSRAAITRFAGLNGGDVDLTSPDSAHSLLCFFSLTCPSCVEEIEVWRHLSRLGRDRGVRTLVVSINSEPDSIRRFVQAYGFSDLPVVYDPDGGVQASFKIRLIPQYLLFDRGGRLVHRSIGLSRPQGLDPVARAEEILAASTIAR